MTSSVAPGFIMFQGRLFGTTHLISIAPPKADGGKHIIEARVTGGVSYSEEYESPEEAAARYLAIAALLLDDPSITDLPEMPEPVEAPVVARVIPLASSD